MDDQPLLAAAPPHGLATLRARIDAIDDSIHDLLMRRFAEIDKMVHVGVKSGPKIRPGREAAILRRLLGRNSGTLPPQTIIRFWREMFAGALIVEGGQTVAVCDGEGGADRVALAREHFGPLTPLRRHHNPAQTLADLARDTAQVAVLPAFGDDDAGAWWAQLAPNGPHRFSIIGKLPFWTRRVEGAPAGEAYIAAALRPDASGADRGLISLAFSADTSRAKVTALLLAAGLAPGAIWILRDPADAGIRALVEVDGLVEDEDPRLAAITGLNRPPAMLGGFAVPLGDPGPVHDTVPQDAP